MPFIPDPFEAKVRIPVRFENGAMNFQAKSLNHAYSLVSQRFEPERTSHSGNVFQLAFVRRGDHWVSLGDLRRYFEAGYEENLIKSSQGKDNA